MSDITRDDLRVNLGPYVYGQGDPCEPITDEEFDRLAREAGYIKWSATASDAVRFITHWLESNPDKALRALLTDQCETCGGTGDGGHYGVGCEECGGRGWLPKDKVELQWQCVKLDLMWLEGDRTAGARNGLPEHCREDHPSWNCGWMLSIKVDWLESENE